jgi:hypothetical protein
MNLVDLPRIQLHRFPKPCAFAEKELNQYFAEHKHKGLVIIMDIRHPLTL